MTALNTLDDLLLHEVKDLYSAESQLVEGLPKAAAAASDDNLRSALEHHLDETKNHVKRLEKVFDALDASVESEHCQGMEGLLAEAEEVIGEQGEPHVKDAAIIAGAQKIEHYEIAGYGTATRLAKEAGREDVARILHETLEEEKKADEKLTQVATGAGRGSGVNQEAASRS